MLSPKIQFINTPNNVVKFRSDIVSNLKGVDQKCISLKVSNLGSFHCGLVVRLLLKEPANILHFHHLHRMPDKGLVQEIFYELSSKQSIVKLDFFGIKKSLRKVALQHLTALFNRDAEDIYRKNSSTMVLEISLVDCKTKAVFHSISYELSDKKEDIDIVDFSPHYILFEDDKIIITVISQSPEKDTDSISLELEMESDTTKVLRARDLNKPTSQKNVFLFHLSRSDLKKEKFRARLCRRGARTVYSKWLNFVICKSEIEHGKRKAVFSDECQPPPAKMSKSISSSISEDRLSEVYITDFFSNSHSEPRKNLQNFFQTKILKAIARVGHDFAFGKEETEYMKNIGRKLPVVYILQDDVGDSPLHNAILKNQESRADRILEIVYENFPNDLFLKNTSDHTALILSPACGVSAGFVQKLLYYGFDVADKDIDGNNALTIAVEYKNTEVLHTLVQHAQINKSFQNDTFEIVSLVKKTILERYFEGYQILMESQLDDKISYMDSSYFDLDSESAEVFNQFYQQLNLQVHPLAEINLDNYDMDELFETLDLFE